MATNKLIVILGPTASGKSEAAMRIAQKHNGEIICADSRTVYKGLDIGTAKPSNEDKKNVPHHMLDIVKPNETFTAGKFQRLAEEAITEIKARGKLPLLVGGSGLFIDSVLFNYKFGAPANSEQRKILEQKSIEELQNYCEENNIELPYNYYNKRHLVRTIEQQGINRQREKTPREDAFIVGISPGKEILNERIQKRAKDMFNKGVVIEATKIAKLYGWNSPGLSGNAYPIIKRFLFGEISQEECIELFKKADWQLARRQMTWFRRNPSIHWCEKSEEAEQLINDYLSKN